MTGGAALERVVEELRTLAVVRRVILFGSRARGDHAPRADFDLAVEAPEANAAQWDAIARCVDGAATLVPIDLVRLDLAPEDLRNRIDSEGRILYER